MTTLYALALAALLFAPLGDDPPAELLGEYRLLPGESKALVWGLAAARNVAFPDDETYADDTFDGTAYVLYRRAQGRPLPYPADPVLGVRP